MADKQKRSKPSPQRDTEAVRASPPAEDEPLTEQEQEKMAELSYAADELDVERGGAEETLGTCALCGKTDFLGRDGACSACAEKLQSMSSTVSDTVSGLDVKALAALAAEAEAAEKPGRSSRTRVLQRFGKSGPTPLQNPFSVALGEDGVIYVLDRPDRQQYRLLRFAAPAGEGELLVACSKGAGPEQLNQPKGVAVDAAGIAYIPDAGNNRIQRFGPDGAALGPFGREGEEAGQLSYPSDVEIHASGALYVADTCNCRIQKFTPQGIALACFGEEDEVGLEEPTGVCLAPDETLYVADTHNHRVVVLSPAGALLRTFGEEGTGSGCLSYPSDLRVWSDGTIFVADQDNCRVQTFSPEGVVQSSFALESTSVVAGGDIAVEDDGCVLLCDSQAGEIVRIALLSG